MATKLRHITPLLAILVLCPRVTAQAGPIDRAEILGRLAEGYWPSYVAHLVKTRGIGFSSGDDFINAVKLAGGDGILVERISSTDPGDLAESSDDDPPFSHLATCGQFIHEGDFESAEPECRASIDENPRSPWPLIVTAHLLADLAPGASADSIAKRKAESLIFLQRALTLGPNIAAIHEDMASVLDGNKMTSELETLAVLDPQGLDSGQRQEQESGPPSEILFEQTPQEEPPVPVGGDTPNPQAARQMAVDPDLASAHVSLAFQYRYAQDLERAEQEMKEALQLEPDNARLHIYLAFFYFFQHRVDPCLAELRQAVRIVPFGLDDRDALVAVLKSTGRTPEAVAELQDFLTRSPANVQASDELVEVYMGENDRKSAIAERRRSLQASSLILSDPLQLVDARFDDMEQLACLLYENREFDAAAEEFVFLLGYKPDSAGLHNDYGNLLLAENHVNEALSEYREALRLAPNMSTAHHNVGLCLAIQNQLDGAVKEFRRALQLNPDEPHTQAFLGNALTQMGDLAGGMEQLHEAIKKNPKDAEAHAALAEALDKSKDSSGAIAELKLAIKLRPDFPTAENNLAWIYATAEDRKLRNPAAASALARQAVQSWPQPNPSFLDTLAEALLLNGHRAEAVATETKAVQLDPQNQELQSRLAHFREAANVVSLSKR